MKTKRYTITVEKTEYKGGFSLNFKFPKGNDKLDEDIAKSIINHCLPKVTIREVW